MSADGPEGPVLLCWDGSASAAGAILHAARIFVADRKTAEIIVAAAKEHGAPLIVMGQRGRSGLKAALLGLGSVAQEVLKTFDGPVLLVGRDTAGPREA